MNLSQRYKYELDRKSWAVNNENQGYKKEYKTKSIASSLLSVCTVNDGDGKVNFTEH